MRVEIPGRQIIRLCLVCVTLAVTLTTRLVFADETGRGDVDNQFESQESCPCIPRDDCPRIYGQSAADVRELGVVSSCMEYGTVRCCGVTISVIQETNKHKQETRLGLNGEEEDQRQDQVDVKKNEEKETEEETGESEESYRSSSSTNNSANENLAYTDSEGDLFSAESKMGAGTFQSYASNNKIRLRRRKRPLSSSLNPGTSSDILSSSSSSSSSSTAEQEFGNGYTHTTGSVTGSGAASTTSYAVVDVNSNKVVEAPEWKVVEESPKYSYSSSSQSSPKTGETNYSTMSSSSFTSDDIPSTMFTKSSPALSSLIAPLTRQKYYTVGGGRGGLGSSSGYEGSPGYVRPRSRRPYSSPSLSFSYSLADRSNSDTRINSDGDENDDLIPDSSETLHVPSVNQKQKQEETERPMSLMIRPNQLGRKNISSSSSFRNYAKQPIQLQLGAALRTTNVNATANHSYYNNNNSNSRATVSVINDDIKIDVSGLKTSPNSAAFGSERVLSGAPIYPPYVPKIKPFLLRKTNTYSNTNKTESYVMEKSYNSSSSFSSPSSITTNTTGIATTLAQSGNKTEAPIYPAYRPSLSVDLRTRPQIQTQPHISVPQKSLEIESPTLVSAPASASSTSYYSSSPKLPAYKPKAMLRRRKTTVATTSPENPSESNASVVSAPVFKAYDNHYQTSYNFKNQNYAVISTTHSPETTPVSEPHSEVKYSSVYRKRLRTPANINNQTPYQQQQLLASLERVSNVGVKGEQNLVNENKQVMGASETILDNNQKESGEMTEDDLLTPANYGVARGKQKEYLAVSRVKVFTTAAPTKTKTISPSLYVYNSQSKSSYEMPLTIDEPSISTEAKSSTTTGLNENVSIQGHKNQRNSIKERIIQRRKYTNVSVATSRPLPSRTPVRPSYTHSNNNKNTNHSPVRTISTYSHSRVSSNLNGKNGNSHHLASTSGQTSDASIVSNGNRRFQIPPLFLSISSTERPTEPPSTRKTKIRFQNIYSTTDTSKDRNSNIMNTYPSNNSDHMDRFVDFSTFPLVRQQLKYQTENNNVNEQSNDNDDEKQTGEVREENILINSHPQLTVEVEIEREGEEDEGYHLPLDKKERQKATDNQTLINSFPVPDSDFYNGNISPVEISKQPLAPETYTMDVNLNHSGSQTDTNLPEVYESKPYADLEVVEIGDKQSQDYDSDYGYSKSNFEEKDADEDNLKLQVYGVEEVQAEDEYGDEYGDESEYESSAASTLVESSVGGQRQPHNDMKIISRVGASGSRGGQHQAQKKRINGRISVTNNLIRPSKFNSPDAPLLKVSNTNSKLNVKNGNRKATEKMIRRPTAAPRPMHIGNTNIGSLSPGGIDLQSQKHANVGHHAPNQFSSVSSPSASAQSVGLINNQVSFQSKLPTTFIPNNDVDSKFLSPSPSVFAAAAVSAATSDSSSFASASTDGNHGSIVVKLDHGNNNNNDNIENRNSIYVSTTPPPNGTPKFVFPPFRKLQSVSIVTPEPKSHFPPGSRFSSNINTLHIVNPSQSKTPEQSALEFSGMTTRRRQTSTTRRPNRFNIQSVEMFSKNSKSNGEDGKRHRNQHQKLGATELQTPFTISVSGAAIGVDAGGPTILTNSAFGMRPTLLNPSSDPGTFHQIPISTSVSTERTLLYQIPATDNPSSRNPEYGPTTPISSEYFYGENQSNLLSQNPYNNEASAAPGAEANHSPLEPQPAPEPLPLPFPPPARVINELTQVGVKQRLPSFPTSDRAADNQNRDRNQVNSSSRFPIPQSFEFSNQGNSNSASTQVSPKISTASVFSTINTNHRHKNNNNMSNQGHVDLSSHKQVQPGNKNFVRFPDDVNSGQSQQLIPQLLHGHNENNKDNNRNHHSNINYHHQSLAGDGHTYEVASGQQAGVTGEQSSFSIHLIEKDGGKPDEVSAPLTSFVSTSITNSAAPGPSLSQDNYQHQPHNQYQGNVNLNRNPSFPLQQQESHFIQETGSTAAVAFVPSSAAAEESSMLSANSNSNANADVNFVEVSGHLNSKQGQPLEHHQFHYQQPHQVTESIAKPSESMHLGLRPLTTSSSSFASSSISKGSPTVAAYDGVVGGQSASTTNINSNNYNNNNTPYQNPSQTPAEIMWRPSTYSSPMRHSPSLAPKPISNRFPISIPSQFSSSSVSQAQGSGSVGILSDVNVYGSTDSHSSSATNRPHSPSHPSNSRPYQPAQQGVKFDSSPYSNLPFSYPPEVNNPMHHYQNQNQQQQQNYQYAQYQQQLQKNSQYGAHQYQHQPVPNHSYNNHNNNNNNNGPSGGRYTETRENIPHFYSQNPPQQTRQSPSGFQQPTQYAQEYKQHMAITDQILSHLKSSARTSRARNISSIVDVLENSISGLEKSDQNHEYESDGFDHVIEASEIIEDIQYSPSNSEHENETRNGTFSETTSLPVISALSSRIVSNQIDTQNENEQLDELRQDKKKEVPEFTATKIAALRRMSGESKQLTQHTHSHSHHNHNNNDAIAGNNENSQAVISNVNSPPPSPSSFPESLESRSLASLVDFLESSRLASVTVSNSESSSSSTTSSSSHPNNEGEISRELKAENRLGLGNNTALFSGMPAAIPTKNSSFQQKDFIAPKALERGFFPILPYSEEDPGPILVKIPPKREKILPPTELDSNRNNIQSHHHPLSGDSPLLPSHSKIQPIPSQRSHSHPNPTTNSIPNIVLQNNHITSQSQSSHPQPNHQIPPNSHYQQHTADYPKQS